MGGGTKPAALEPMKTNQNSDNAKLSTLLRQARVSPSLPPRFQENVWRRIEHAEAPVHATGGLVWLDTLAALVLRPRFAYATVATLMLVGILLGTHQGAQAAKQDAQARYVALVAPNSLR